ncbi:MAG: hypothetical protein AAGM67_10500, partial [Bacteroidota bacterium]
YLAFKYQIPLERSFRLANDDTLGIELPFVNKVGSIGIDAQQLLHRTAGHSVYRDARLSITAPQAKNGAHLLWADDEQPMSLTADFGARKNNRVARTWRFWQAGDEAGTIQLRLEGFPEGLQTILLHPGDPALPNDENLRVLPLQTLDDGSYQVMIDPGEEAFVSFSSERSPLLEVEWAGFDARLDAPYLQISWATLHERYIDHFVLERSIDGLSYQPIAEREAAFRSDVVMYYEYVDQDIADIEVGRLHYRLKVVDPNGVFVYSPRLEVALPRLKEMYLDIALLSEDALQLNYLYRGKNTLTAQLINQQAQVVRAYQFGAGPLQSSITLDLSNLPQGIYTLRLEAGSSSKIKRFVRP